MEHLSQQLNQRLLSNQDRFHHEVKGIYSELATSVDKSLKDSLSQSAQIAGESLKPVLEVAMTGIAQEARLQHESLINAAQSQLDSLSERFQTTASKVTNTWTAALASYEQANTNMVSGVAQSMRELANDADQRSGSQLTAMNQAYTRLQTDQALRDQQHNEHADQFFQLMRVELGALRDDEAQRGNQAVERLGELQTALTGHLSTLGTALEAPITRLIQTASEAPRAAADVIGQLRLEMTNSVARDNALLEERSRIMSTLNALLEAINHASVEQRSVIDTLVASSAVALNAAGRQFAAQVGEESAKLADIAAQVTSSAVDVSSLGESFGFAVQSFNAANDKLIANLQKIEGAMNKSMTRSDEQLAYYVAQAREIVDLSIMSQREVFEELRQLPSKQARAGKEVS
jgi:hypothetical protein